MIKWESVLDRKEGSEGIYAVVDVSRAMGQDDLGPLVSSHKTEKAALKAVREVRHGRVVQSVQGIKRSPGDHISGLCDLVRDRHAKWL